MTDWPSFPEGFTFYLPIKSQGERVSVEEAEAQLLARFAECETELENATWQLVRFYSVTGRPVIATRYMDRLISFIDDPEKKATCYLSMGQLMEQIHDFEAAIRFYTQAFSLEPISSEPWYLINNNLGYCLNHFGRHAEAEKYCRAAIGINPVKYNAYKNLGVSLAGQGQFIEAAKCFVTAVRANASDPRALKHLEDLVVEHSEMLSVVPNLTEELQQCRSAVKVAAQLRKRIEENEDKSSHDA